jgi:hypothetical protein
MDKILNRTYKLEDLIVQENCCFSYSDFISHIERELGDPSFAIYIGNYKIASVVRDKYQRWHVSNLSFTYKSKIAALNGLLKRLNGQCRF